MYFTTYFCVEIKTQVITVELLELVTTSAYLLTFLTSPNDELFVINYGYFNEYSVVN